MNRQRLVSLAVLAGGVALLARQSGLVHLDFYLFGLDLRLPLVLS